jgi:serine/threonine protein kinase
MLFVLLHFSRASTDASTRPESDPLRGSDLHGSYAIHYRDERALTMHGEIGHGRFSRVYRATLPDGTPVAAKCLKPGEPWRLRREVRFMELLRDHGVPNAVRLVGVYGDEHAPIIVTELAHRDDAAPIALDDLRWLMRSLLATLNQTHYLNVFHRDIKWANLMVSFKNRTLRVIDWGLAEWVIKDMAIPVVGTKSYKAPELLLGAEKYGPAVDVWAAGVVMGNLMFGCYSFFSGSSESAVLLKQAKIFGTRRIARLAKQYGYTKRVPRVAPRSMLEFALPHTRHLFTRASFDLLVELLRPERADRIKAADALTHDFFA